jgi:hypothetical protein
MRFLNPKRDEGGKAEKDVGWNINGATKISTDEALRDIVNIWSNIAPRMRLVSDSQ